MMFPPLINSRKVPRALILVAFLSPYFRAAEPLKFEVAVIREASSKDTFICHVGPGTLEYSCSLPLPSLLAAALDLPNYSFPHESTPVYFVNAKIPRGSTQDQIHEMMKTLLVQRVNLAYHLEKRLVSGYFMEVDPAKPKAPTTTESLAEARPLGGDNVRQRPAQHPGTIPGTFELRRTNSRDASELQFTGRAVTLRQVASHLSNSYNVVLVDNTDLKGLYSFTFIFRDPQPTEEEEQTEHTKAPSLWSALAKQFGVKVVGKKGAVDFLVIDHARKSPKAD